MSKRKLDPYTLQVVYRRLQREASSLRKRAKGRRIRGDEFTFAAAMNLVDINTASTLEAHAIWAASQARSLESATRKKAAK